VTGDRTAAPAAAPAAVTAAGAAPGRGLVLRVDWRPGTDVLLGTCHCGQTGEAEDPVQIWEWLLGHPGHLREQAP
jgi:hypothetical protein